MPWSEVSVMDLRLEFVMLAEQPGSNVSALCRRFGISRKTGYKWLGRAGSGAALSDRSRRPRSNPRRTPEGMEAAVLAVRSDHPCWGGRKIARRLVDLGETDVPAPSTVTGDPAAPWRRLGAGRNACRLPALRALAAERALADGLQRPFCLGSGSLPSVDRAGRLLALQPVPGGLRQRAGRDGARASAGSIPSLWPAGVDHRRQRLALGRWTEHAVHAARRLVSAPRHRPQSQPSLSSSDAGQGRALPRPRPFPEALPPIEYAPEHQVRRVQDKGRISFKGKIFKLPKAFAGYPVGLVPTTHDGTWKVIFASRQIAQLDMRDGTVKTVTHVSEHL